MRKISAILAVLALPTLGGAAVYNGNGATGFGGPVGTGNVTITDDASGMVITLNKGANGFNDALVLYLDTQPGGFSDTSLFSDNADGGRGAISGANSGNPSRSTVTFPGGFGADYGIAVENGFIGVFQLAPGGNGSLNFLFGQGQSGNNNAPSYSISISPAQMAQLGLIAESGQSFDFFGSYFSTSAYSSK